MIFTYPLKLRFKLLTFTPAFSVVDNSNKEVLYTEQKFFALRESVKLFNNSSDKKQLYGIKTQQIIDFGAQYSFFNGTDETNPIGAIKEEGLKTLFKASYLLLDKTNTQKFKITEVNPLIRVLDALLEMLPYVGLVAGYFFNPQYQIINTQTNGVVMMIKKKPSFWERQFEISVLTQNLSPEDETICILASFMMIMLQKNRG